MKPRIRNGQRGAALILEIIIYLVIVALIAVAVTTGVRAIRDLIFAEHARGDVRNIQSWVESRYIQDGMYPGTSAGGYVGLTPGIPPLTVANGRSNDTYLSSVNGANAGYCILVYSHTISDINKVRFWMISTDPSKIYQQGTKTAPTGPPETGIPGVTCAM